MHSCHQNSRGSLPKMHLQCLLPQHQMISWDLLNRTLIFTINGWRQSILPSCICTLAAAMALVCEYNTSLQINGSKDSVNGWTCKDYCNRKSNQHCWCFPASY